MRSGIASYENPLYRSFAVYNAGRPEKQRFFAGIASRGQKTGGWAALSARTSRQIGDRPAPDGKRERRCQSVPSAAR
jgi:hypothetical protein